MAWDINLQNPRWLAVVLERYLSMGVVPAEGPPPPLLTEGTVRLLLPDGTAFETKGRVIRASGENEFLLQADGLPDLDALRRMTKVSRISVATAASSAQSGAGVPSSTTLVDDLLSTVSPENLLFKDAAPAATPATPATPVGRLTVEATPSAPLARPVPPSSRQTPVTQRHPPSGDPEFDLLEGVVETVKVGVPRYPGHATPVSSHRIPAAPTPKASPVLAANATPAPAAMAPPSQHEATVPSATPGSPRQPPTIRISTARAGTPGSVKVVVERQGEGKAGDVDAVLGVTGRETEYSDVYARVRDLSLQDKQRLARHGRRTVRQILMRDTNKSLQRLVLSNPDILLDEVLEYANWPGLAKDALEFIATNSIWTSSRMVILAIVKNPSSPIEMAIKLVPRLGPSEWRLLVRPNVVRNPVAAAARKALESTRE